MHWSYIDSSPEENPHEFFIDCQTGEIIEKSLTYTNADGFLRTIQILADTEDSFLVLMDETEGQIILTDREGIPRVYDFPHFGVYALIAKEDYWNNIPNYHTIEDRVIRKK